MPIRGSASGQPHPFCHHCLTMSYPFGRLMVPQPRRNAILTSLLASLLVAAGCAPPIQEPQRETVIDRPTLCSRIDAALETACSGRRLDASVQGAWQAVHGILAFGKDLPIAHGSEVSSALDYLLGGGPMAGWNLRPGNPGVIAVLEEGSITGQGHPDQWIGYLSQCGVAEDPSGLAGGLPLDTPLIVAGRRFTLGDLLTQAKHDIRPGQEASWTLMALAAYLPPDTSWQSSDGRKWTTEDVVRMEAESEIVGAACGGTHRLYGLGAAVLAYRQAHGEPDPDSGWAHAEDVLDYHIDLARRFQQADGSFSVNYFERPSRSPDVFSTLSATGHVFEVLALVLDGASLADPWVTRAAERLVTLLEQTADIDAECGALYHAAHGLAIYRHRVCPPKKSTTEESDDLRLPSSTGG